LIGFKYDRTAASAVTSIGPTERNELLAPKTPRAGATFTGLYLYGCFIDKFHIR
jgi:hypothetical protein